MTRAIAEIGLKRIKEAFDAEVWEDCAPSPNHVLREKARDAYALVSMLSDKIDQQILDVALKLKISAQLAVGFDNIDLQEATNLGIW